MRRIVVTFLLFVGLSTNAQIRLDDINRIYIHAFVPLSEKLTNESQKLLETKLLQIISNNGISDSEYGNRFVLTAKINTLSKDVVAGPPTRISIKAEITLVLGDVVDNKIYAQLPIQVMGIGQSVEKTLISVIKNIKTNSPQICSFIQEGKNKILSYYQTNCEDIINEACNEASLQHFEDALIRLASVPDVCSDCREKAFANAELIFVKMINSRGEEHLNEARRLWAENPTKEGAKQTMHILSQINFAASCRPQVELLLKEITSKINEIDRREWKHEMDVYKDNIDREKREWKQQVREYDDRVKTQRMYLNACRDVAIENARHQPKVVTRFVNYNRVLLW